MDSKVIITIEMKVLDKKGKNTIACTLSTT